MSAAVLALALTGCTSSASSIPSPVMPSSPQEPPGGVDAPLPAPAHAPLIVHDPGQVTGTLYGPCHYRDGGQLPDPVCTPGAYDASVTAAKLCAPGYTTRSYRPPASATDRFKYRQAYPAYGAPASERTELDHLIPLELGGANDAANLWPEVPPDPNPKDRIETALHDWVCAVTGQAAEKRLGRARYAIAEDWMTAERVLGVPG